MYKPKSSVSFALRAIAEPARSKQNDKSHPVSQFSTFTPRLRYTRRTKSSSHSPIHSHSSSRSIDPHEDRKEGKERPTRPDPLSDQIRARPLIDPSPRSPTPPPPVSTHRVVTRIPHHSHIIRTTKNARLTPNPRSQAINQSNQIHNPIEACRNAGRTFILCIRGRRPSIQRAIIERFREGQSMRRRRRHARRRSRRGDRHARRRRQSSSYSRHLVWKGAASDPCRSVPFGLRHDGDPIDRS